MTTPTAEIRAINGKRGSIDLREYRSELAGGLLDGAGGSRGDWRLQAVLRDFESPDRPVLAELARLHDMEPDEVAENLADGIHAARRANVELAALPTGVRPDCHGLI